MLCACTWIVMHLPQIQLFRTCRRSTYNHLQTWLNDAKNLTSPNTVLLPLLLLLPILLSLLLLLLLPLSLLPLPPLPLLLLIRSPLSYRRFLVFHAIIMMTAVVTSSRYCMVLKQPVKLLLMNLPVHMRTVVHQLIITICHYW